MISIIHWKNFVRSYLLVIRMISSHHPASFSPLRLASKSPLTGIIISIAFLKTLQMILFYFFDVFFYLPLTSFSNLGTCFLCCFKTCPIALRESCVGKLCKNIIIANHNSKSRFWHYCCKCFRRKNVFQETYNTMFKFGFQQEGLIS